MILAELCYGLTAAYLKVYKQQITMVFIPVLAYLSQSNICIKGLFDIRTPKIHN